MRKIALYLAALAAPAIAHAQTTCKGLTFNDDFSGLGQWSVGGGGPLSDGNDGLASFQAPTQNSTEVTGPNGLTIGVQPIAAPNGAAFEAGLINTQNTHTQLYGVVQATVNVPASIEQKGMSWAVWMLGTKMVSGSNQGWPFEIDLAEMYGSAFDSAMHSGFNSNNAQGSITTIPPGQYTFTVDWEPDKITWYIGKQQTAQIDTPADAHVPMFMIIGTGATHGTGWTGEAQPGSSGSINVLRVRAFDNMQDLNACDGQEVSFTPNTGGPSVQQGQDAVQAANNLSVADVARLAAQGFTGDGQSTGSTIAANAPTAVSSAPPDAGAQLQSVQDVASVASGDSPPAQPIVLSSNAPSGTMPAPAAATTSVSIDASGTNQTITEPTGNGTGTVSGTNNSVTAIGGIQMLDITGTGNTILTGQYDDSATVEATGNTIDLGAGANTITLAYKQKAATGLAAISATQIDQDVKGLAPLAPAGNIFVAPQPGMGVLTIQGTPMDSKDTIDLTKSLAGVAGWDHQVSDIPQFVTVGSGPTGTDISVQGRVVVVLGSGVTQGNVSQYLTSK